jgi:hypothetical protein
MLHLGLLGETRLGQSMEVKSLRSVHRWIAATAACLVLGCHIDACRAQSRPTSASERLQVFQWFSGVGFPDVKNAKFVRRPDGRDQHGFVLGENKQAWTVVTVGLVSRTVERQQRLWGGRTVDLNCVPEDFAAFVNTASRERLNGYGPLDDEFEYGLSKATKRFVIAWICWRRGLDEQAVTFSTAQRKSPLIF